MHRIGIALATFLILASISTPVSFVQDKEKPAAKASTAAAAVVNLNSAARPQLETRPGVGAATAKRILEYRQAKGTFKKVVGTSRVGYHVPESNGPTSAILGNTLPVQRDAAAGVRQKSAK